MLDVSIRPLELNDAYTSVKWRNIPELWIHTTFKADHKITIQDELNWMEKVTKDPTSARFAILAAGVYIGNIYLTNIQQDVGEYHIFIGEKDYWGKGIARKASVLIINYGKEKLKLNIIRLGVKSDNGAAQHLYESLGFIETGKDKDDFKIMELKLADWDGDPRDKMK